MLQNTYYFTRAPAGPARQAARCLLLTWRVVFCLVAAVAVWPDMQQQQQPLCYFVLLLLLLLLFFSAFSVHHGCGRILTLLGTFQKRSSAGGLSPASEHKALLPSTRQN